MAPRAKPVVPESTSPEPEPVIPVFPMTIIKRIFVYAASPSKGHSDPPSSQVATTLALVCTHAAIWMRSVRWCFVSLTSGEKIDKVAQRLLTASEAEVAPHPVELVRNLWIRAEGPSFDLEPDQWFEDRWSGTGKALVKYGELENLAVDIALTRQWLGGLGARHALPTMVTLLKSKNTDHVETFLYTSPVFKSATHVTIEPFWTELTGMHNRGQPFKYWPAITHVCVRVPATLENPKTDTKALEYFCRSVHDFQQTIICIDTETGKRCTADNSVWRLLCQMTSRWRNLYVLPFWIPARREWRAWCEGGVTIWDRALDPRQRTPRHPVLPAFLSRNHPETTVRSDAEISLISRDMDVRMNVAEEPVLDNVVGATIVHNENPFDITNLLQQDADDLNSILFPPSDANYLELWDMYMDDSKFESASSDTGESPWI